TSLLVTRGTSHPNTTFTVWFMPAVQEQVEQGLLEQGLLLFLCHSCPTATLRRPIKSDSTPQARVKGSPKIQDVNKKVVKVQPGQHAAVRRDRRRMRKPGTPPERAGAPRIGYLGGRDRSWQHEPQCSDYEHGRIRPWRH
ncbi:hypothetical protein BN1723_009702, partial [Verticillium longisporum]